MNIGSKLVLSYPKGLLERKVVFIGGWFQDINTRPASILKAMVANNEWWGGN